MFQRLKGAIDSRIAEEQARQRQAVLSASPQRPQQRRRPQTQDGSAGRVSSRQREQGPLPNEKGPDPADFEPEFAIGDDDSAVPSRISTPKPEVKEEDAQPVGEAEQDGENTTRKGAEAEALDANGSPTSPARSPELPTGVRVKLRKLERLEPKYGELLKAYRVAHARIQVIEPFEASLRENTPLTSIADPAALVEYLNQITLKSDMVLEELKRVTAEKDELKKKSDHSEDTASQLRLEVTELKKQLAERPSVAVSGDQATVLHEAGSDTTTREQTNAKDPASPDTLSKSPTLLSSRIPSISLFSQRSKATSPPPNDTSEDFFSYDSEVPRLEAELQERQVEIVNLTKTVQNLKADLAVARESTEGMVQSLETATRELHTLRDAKDKFDSTKSELEQRITNLMANSSIDSNRSQEIQKQLERLESERNDEAKELEKLETQINELDKANSDLDTQLEERRKEANILNEKLSQKDSIVKDLEDSLAMMKLAARQDKQQQEADAKPIKDQLLTVQKIKTNLDDQLEAARKTITQLKQDITTNQDNFEQRPSTKAFGFLNEKAQADLPSLQSRDDVVNYLAANFGLRKDGVGADSTRAIDASVAPSEASTVPSTKKKNKKKKKGKGNQAAADDTEPGLPVKVSENLAEIEETEQPQVATSSDQVSKLENEVTALRSEIENKSAAIDRLVKQIKDQEALKEEIETLRDDLLHQGEEHVEARDALKTAEAARKALRENVEKLEKELVDAQKKLSSGMESEMSHKETLDEVAGLRAKSASLQTDLSAAEQLATARFKDITDLRELLSKAQPELRNLRSEVSELKSAKDDLKNKVGELSRLESRHEDLKAEMKGLSKRLGDKDSEIKELQKKIEQETSTRTRAEEDLRTAQSELRSAEARRQGAVALSEETSMDLAKSKEEASTLKAEMRSLGDQISNHNRQVSQLKEEVSLKTALHGSSQSLVQSLRDQMHELSTQARETTTRAENLDEELAEAQRMLSERTREGQTMRMLLNQAETGTESRIREMKERMDAAIEERDRVEDEASVSSRRMMREVEDAKNKARDAQRALKVLEDEKEELEGRQREWKRRRDELEQATERATKEVEDVRTAMAGLREALDESERQVRDVESQKSDLRKVGDEARERLETLTKANKNLTEDLKAAQQAVQAGGPRKPPSSVRPGLESSGLQSSRTSFDSAGARSPGPPTNNNPRERDRGERLSTTTSRSDTPTGMSQATVDYVYLKNVLLQFLEQKDKAHQRQLIPVLGMLLHFDRKDEQKWISAISSR